MEKWLLESGGQFVLIKALVFFWSLTKIEQIQSEQLWFPSVAFLSSFKFKQVMALNGHGVLFCNICVPSQNLIVSFDHWNYKFTCWNLKKHFLFRNTHQCLRTWCLGLFLCFFFICGNSVFQIFKHVALMGKKKISGTVKDNPSQQLSIAQLLSRSPLLLSYKTQQI